MMAEDMAGRMSLEVMNVDRSAPSSLEGVAYGVARHIAKLSLQSLRVCANTGGGSRSVMLCEKSRVVLDILGPERSLR